MSTGGTFCTAINCMDGRTQEPVITYMKKRFGTQYVDTITEPGPNRIVAEKEPSHLFDSILSRTAISVHKHGSQAIALVGHHDCAGNPCEYQRQIAQLRQGVAHLRSAYPALTVIGLWLDQTWTVSEVKC